MGSREARKLLAQCRVSLIYSSSPPWGQATDKTACPCRSNGDDHKLLKISYIISRRTSIDVFSGKSSDIGNFAKGLIGKLADGKVMEGLGDAAGTLLTKLIGSSSGSAQTETI